MGSVGTPLTNAPEILSGKIYGYESDIWSLGIIYYQMLYRDYPFKATNQ